MSSKDRGLRSSRATRLKIALAFGAQSACVASVGPSDLGQSDEEAAQGDGGSTPSVDNRCDKMDVVFVIDDSGSMGEEQENLRANFPAFVSVLEEFGASSVDYRVAVTTTGVSKTLSVEASPGYSSDVSLFGNDGVFLNRGCTGAYNWLQRSDTNVAERFACLADVGVDGPPFEMPLEAIRLAIEDRVDDGTNASFFRPDALLGVVFLSDENDCSRSDNPIRLEGEDAVRRVCNVSEDVQNYVDSLDRLKGERARWATAVIAGLRDCESSFGSAVEATRLLDFAALTGANAVTSSICDGDLSQALEEAMATFDQACRNFPSVE